MSNTGINTGAWRFLPAEPASIWIASVLGPGCDSNAFNASASWPFRPLTAASTVISSSPYLRSMVTIGATRLAAGNCPSEAVSWRRTCQLGSSASFMTAASMALSVRKGSQKRTAPLRTAAFLSPSAARAVAASIEPMPSSVHSACSRVRQSGAFAASSFSAGTTDLSLRWTRSCWAVSRHQPIGLDRWATSWAGVSSSICGFSTLCMPEWITRKMRP